MHTYTGVREWVRGRLEAVREGLQTHENEVERIVRQVRQQHRNNTVNNTATTQSTTPQQRSQQHRNNTVNNTSRTQSTTPLTHTHTHLNPTPNYDQILLSRKLNLNPKVLPQKMSRSPFSLVLRRERRVWRETTVCGERHVCLPQYHTLFYPNIYIYMCICLRGDMWCSGENSSAKS